MKNNDKEEITVGYEKVKLLTNVWLYAMVFLLKRKLKEFCKIEPIIWVFSMKASG